MVEVFRVNDWRVTTSTNGYFITNLRHTENKAFYSPDAQRYSFTNGNYFKIPKTIDYFCKGMELPRRSRNTDKLTSRTYGIEIECFHKTNSNIREDVVQAIRQLGLSCEFMGYSHTVVSGWKVVTDSSIKGGTGLEVVSPVLTGEQGLEEISKVLGVLNNLGCRVNKSTGLHVHHGARDLQTDALRQIFVMYRENEQLFDSLVSKSRRDNNNNYCESLNRYRNQMFPDTRYVKVNYKSYVKYGTIEFRHHNGTLNIDKISHWIRLTQRVVERAGKYTRRFNNLEEMISFLGLDAYLNWYMERAEELAEVV